MAESRYQFTVFADMQDKDPDLFKMFEMMQPEAGMRVWLEKYPDDFPDREMTRVLDRVASDGTPIIKPIH